MDRLPLARSIAIILVLAFVAAPKSSGQDIPAVGADATLDVATWNIEWFGHSTNGPSNVPGQFNNVRSIIESSEMDIWGLQEISSPSLFNALLDSLGDGYGGALATYSQTQKTAFIYRTDVIAPRGAVRHIMEGVDHVFGGRAPLRMEADVTLPDTSLVAVFITMHMKAGSDAASYDQRDEASRRLKAHLDVLYPTQNVVVLADFNDRLTTSIRSGLDTPYGNFLQDENRYRFITLEAEERGEVSFPSRDGSIIDHILITDELSHAYVEDSARPWSELPRILIGYTSTTSDHYPVYARFDFSRGTSSAAPARWATASLDEPYPNPASGPVTISYSLEAASEVVIDVLDASGRRVARIDDGFRSPGRYEVDWSANGLASGLYLLRLNAGPHVEARTFVLVR